MMLRGSTREFGGKMWALQCPATTNVASCHANLQQDAQSMWHFVGSVVCECSERIVFNFGSGEVAVEGSAVSVWGIAASSKQTEKVNDTN